MQETTIPMPDHIMTMAELKEYKAMMNKVFNSDNPFAILNMTNEDHCKFNDLSVKYGAFRRWVEYQQMNN